MSINFGLPTRTIPIPKSKYNLKCPYALPDSKKTGVTIHNTANNPSAEREARFAAGNDWQVSSHIYVDESEVVISVPFDRAAWHAGDGVNGKGNRTQLCVEICRSTSDINTFKKAEHNRAIATAHILKHYGWTTKNMTKHQDWSGKNCPHRTLELGWPRFVKMVDNELRKISQTYKTQTPILGKPTTNIEQMRQYAINNQAPKYWVDLAKIAYERSVAYGVDPAVTWAQANKETNFGKFTGVLDKSFNNPCGMKTRKGGSDTDPKAHFRFRSWHNGFSGMAQHLALYAGSRSYPWKVNFDPRNFSSIHGTAKTVEELGGAWAPARDYGTDIVKRMTALVKTKDDGNGVTGQVKESGSDMGKVKYAIAFAHDGDTINALNFLNALAPGSAGLFKVTAGADISGLPGEQIIFVGGVDIKGADLVVKGGNRILTLDAVNKEIQKIHKK